MIALRITGWPGPAQPKPHGHRQMIEPMPRAPRMEPLITPTSSQPKADRERITRKG